MAKIGLVIGGGTGPELADVFKSTLNLVAKKRGIHLEIIECGHVFKTYADLKSIGIEESRVITASELEQLEAFYRRFYLEGGRVIFRTALNAELLYEFRKRYMSIKTFHFSVGNKRILVIRDQMQGYYANDDYTVRDGLLSFKGSYKEELFRLIASSAINEAEKYLRKPFGIWVVYKHHLFGAVIEEWTKDTLPDAKICQPGHAIELLWRHTASSAENDGDVLLILGNEVGDILHEALIFMFGIGTRQTLFSRNVYLHKDIEGLVEYQTVHGSVDDLKGKDCVDPTATLRAVGAIVEEALQVGGFSNLMEKAIATYACHSAGARTSEVIAAVHNYLKGAVFDGGVA
jgi:isocitrate/isopropylmalate dehydrogenase